MGPLIVAAAASYFGSKSGGGGGGGGYGNGPSASGVNASIGAGEWNVATGGSTLKKNADPQSVFGDQSAANTKDLMIFGGLALAGILIVKMLTKKK